MNRAIAVLLVVQITLLILVLFSLRELKQEVMASSHDIATMRLPTQFVLHEPLCADKLLTIMGIDHVRVRRDLPWNVSVSTPP